MIKVYFTSLTFFFKYSIFILILCAENNFEKLILKNVIYMRCNNFKKYSLIKNSLYVHVCVCVHAYLYMPMCVSSL